MISEDEFRWVEEQLHGDYDHLLLGTSLPWLLPRALHDLEAWNEAMANHAGTRRGRFAERLRRAADLEHWAAFRESFERLGELLASVARGERATDARPPASISVLSGDVHHAYAAEAHFDRPTDAPVYQLTCSPLHNFVPRAMKFAFRAAWSRAAERMASRLLGLSGPVPTPSLHWDQLCGPFFGNEIAVLIIDGRRADVVIEQSAPSDHPEPLTEVARLQLAG